MKKEGFPVETEKPWKVGNKMVRERGTYDRYGRSRSTISPLGCGDTSGDEKLTVHHQEGEDITPRDTISISPSTFPLGPPRPARTGPPACWCRACRTLSHPAPITLISISMTSWISCAVSSPARTQVSPGREDMFDDGRTDPGNKDQLGELLFPHRGFQSMREPTRSTWFQPSSARWKKPLQR